MTWFICDVSTVFVVAMFLQCTVFISEATEVVSASKQWAPTMLALPVPLHLIKTVPVTFTGCFATVCRSSDAHFNIFIYSIFL